MDIKTNGSEVEINTVEIEGSTADEEFCVNQSGNAFITSADNSNFLEESGQYVKITTTNGDQYIPLTTFLGSFNASFQAPVVESSSTFESSLACETPVLSTSLTTSSAQYIIPGNSSSNVITIIKKETYVNDTSEENYAKLVRLGKSDCERIKPTGSHNIISPVKRTRLAPKPSTSQDVFYDNSSFDSFAADETASVSSLIESSASVVPKEEPPILLHEGSCVDINGRRCILEKDPNTGLLRALPLKAPKRRRGRPRKSATKNTDNPKPPAVKAERENSAVQGLLGLSEADGVRKSLRTRKRPSIYTEEYVVDNPSLETGDPEDGDPYDPYREDGEVVVRGRGRPLLPERTVNKDLQRLKNCLATLGFPVKRGPGRPTKKMPKLVLPNTPTTSVDGNLVRVVGSEASKALCGTSRNAYSLVKTVIATQESATSKPPAFILPKPSPAPGTSLLKPIDISSTTQTVLQLGNEGSYQDANSQMQASFVPLAAQLGTTHSYDENVRVERNKDGTLTVRFSSDPPVPIDNSVAKQMASASAYYGDIFGTTEDATGHNLSADQIGNEHVSPIKMEDTNNTTYLTITDGPPNESVMLENVTSEQAISDVVDTKPIKTETPTKKTVIIPKNNHKLVKSLNFKPMLLPSGAKIVKIILGKDGKLFSPAYRNTATPCNVVLRKTSDGNSAETVPSSVSASSSSVATTRSPQQSATTSSPEALSSGHKDSSFAKYMSGGLNIVLLNSGTHGGTENTYISSQSNPEQANLDENNKIVKAEDFSNTADLNEAHRFDQNNGGNGNSTSSGAHNAVDTVTGKDGEIYVIERNSEDFSTVQNNDVVSKSINEEMVTFTINNGQLVTNSGYNGDIVTETANIKEMDTSTENNGEAVTVADNDVKMVTGNRSNWEIVTVNENNGERPVEAQNEWEIVTDTGISGEMVTDTGTSGDIVTDTGNSGDIVTDTGNSGKMVTDIGNSGEMVTDTSNSGEIATDTGNSCEMVTDTGIIGENSRSIVVGEENNRKTVADLEGSEEIFTDIGNSGETTSCSKNHGEMVKDTDKNEKIAIWTGNSWEISNGTDNGSSALTDAHSNHAKIAKFIIMNENNKSATVTNEDNGSKFISCQDGSCFIGKGNTDSVVTYVVKPGGAEPSLVTAGTGANGNIVNETGLATNKEHVLGDETSLEHMKTEPTNTPQDISTTVSTLIFQTGAKNVTANSNSNSTGLMLLRRGCKLVQLKLGSAQTTAKGNTPVKLGLKTHEKDLPALRCSRCDFQAYFQEQLMSHIASHKDCEVHSCKSCNFHWFQHIELVQHFRDLHPKCICKLCDYMAEQFYQVRRHMQSHDPDLCTCTLCGKKYKDQYILKMHIRTVHMPADVLFECDVCSKKFTRKAHLKRHLRIHEPEKPWKCSYCDYRGCERSDITKHEVVHKDPRHSCPICHRAFRHEKNRDLHVKRHRGQRDYKCGVCDFYGYTFTDIRKHIERKHSEQRALYFCQSCAQSLPTKEILESHRAQCPNAGKGDQLMTPDSVFSTGKTQIVMTSSQAVSHTGVVSLLREISRDLLNSDLSVSGVPSSLSPVPHTSTAQHPHQPPTPTSVSMDLSSQLQGHIIQLGEGVEFLGEANEVEEEEEDEGVSLKDDRRTGVSETQDSMLSGSAGMGQQMTLDYTRNESGGDSEGEDLGLHREEDDEDDDLHLREEREGESRADYGISDESL